MTATLEQLFAMEVGDVAEMQSLMPAISKQPTTYEAVTAEEGKSVQFVVRFHDVTVCRRTLTKNSKGEFKWL